MPLPLRVLLVLGALFTFYMITRRVRKKKILMQDAIYWLVLGVLILIVAIFPSGIIRLAAWLGFMSASNFVFLIIVALLLIKIFSLSCDVSLLRHKVEELSQEDALSEKRLEEERAQRHKAALERKRAADAARTDADSHQ